MNGKYMGWREQRWVKRDADRLQRMAEKKQKKQEDAQCRKCTSNTEATRR